jgi:hypothetical protein
MREEKALGFVICFLLVLTFGSCQQELEEQTVVYSDDLYVTKEYLVERHPPVVRNGFGMDLFHEGNSAHDTLYLNDRLPSWHPNAPYETGITLKKYNEEKKDSIDFNYDLLFFNEFAYTQNYAGDYNGSGYPVIFLYTDPHNANKSAKAAMVGQGISCFEAFKYDSIKVYEDSLKADPLINLNALRVEMHTATVDGTIMLQDSISTLYKNLAIGDKFRPTIGGVFTISDASDEAQKDFQPVFLIRTREGLYAKFMVTRFKGVGVNTQKLSLQWQDLKNN